MPIVDSVVGALRAKNAPHVKHLRIGPSEINANCKREVVFNRIPEMVARKAPPTDKSIMTLLTGTAVHEYFQGTVLPRMEGYELVEAERYIETETLNGYIDAILRDVATGEEWVGELKTANSEKFAHMKTTGAPEEYYVDQVTLYMGVTGIHRGMIIVINKDLAVKNILTPIHMDGPIPEADLVLGFTVDFDQARFDRLMKKVQELYDLVAKRDESIPEKFRAPNKFPCMWCDYKKVCHPDAYQEMSFYSPGTPGHLKANFSRIVQSLVTVNGELERLITEKSVLERDLKRVFYGLGKYSRIRGKRSIVAFDNSGLSIAGIEPSLEPETPEIDR